MPVLHTYKNKSGYYVKARHNGLNSTFQLTSQAIEYLRADGRLMDGAEIGMDIFLQLLRKGWAFTHGSGHSDDPSPQQPKLLPEANWFIGPNGLTLELIAVSVFNVDSTGPMTLYLGGTSIPGTLRSRKFVPDSTVPVRVENLLPEGTSERIALYDSNECLVAHEFIDLPHEDSLLFKSQRLCDEQTIYTSLQEIQRSFPNGICMLCRSIETFQVKGGRFAQLHLGWKDYHVLTIEPEDEEILEIDIFSGDRHWRVRERPLLQLKAYAEQNIETDRFAFASEDHVYLAQENSALTVAIENWSCLAAANEISIDTYIVVETVHGSRRVKLEKLSGFMKSEQNNETEISLQLFCHAYRIRIDDSPVLVRLEGSYCREDLRLQFFIVSKKIEILHTRINDYPSIRLADESTLVSSGTVYSLSDAIASKEVEATIQILDQQSLSVRWIPIVVDAVLLGDEKLIENDGCYNLSIFKNNYELLLLSPHNFHWTIRSGNSHKVFTGPQRRNVEELIDWNTVREDGDVVVLLARTKGKDICQWNILSGPIDVTVEAEWLHVTGDEAIELNCFVSWFGLPEEDVSVRVLADGHLIRESALSVAESCDPPGKREFAVGFVFEGLDLTILSRTGELVVEVAKRNAVLASRLASSFPDINATSTPEEIEALIRALHKRVTDSSTPELYLEHILYLAEEHVAAMSRMPFENVTLSSSLRRTSEDNNVRCGLHLLEALTAQKEVLNRLPEKLKSDTKPYLFVQSLQVFYELYLNDIGHGHAGTLEALSEELKLMAGNFRSEHIRDWSNAMASYALEKATTTSLPPADQCAAGNFTAAQSRPLMTYNADFIHWLNRT